MRIVGITGGIASGKSLVFNQFMALGAYGIDCDVLSREVVRSCSKAWWKILEVFGTEILKRNLAIDRNKLREIVFHDSDKRKVLEAIIHPEVREQYRDMIAAIKRIEPIPPLVVIDVPLLIETGLKSEFETVIVVYVKEETQIRRVMAREDVTEEEAKMLIGLQMPLSEKLKFADIVINNEGTLEETEQQVREVYLRLVK
ncbi:MAG: dephospho-CoA kinase [Halobacteriota archaeon]